MASSYKHGAYGLLLDSKVKSAVQASTAPFYIGLARVNLIRGYAEKDLVNNPKQLISLSQAQSTVGWSKNGWDTGFGISEAISAHFDNPAGNIGPIYAVNVLDPDIHRKVSPTSAVLYFKSRTATITSDDIILDTLVINETVNRTLAVSSKTASYTGQDLDINTLVVYKSDGTEAAITTDYTASYASGTLTVTLTNDGALADYAEVAISVNQLKKEGADKDYTVSYDFGTSTVSIKLCSDLLSTNMTAVYYEIDTSAITPETVIGSAAGAKPTGIYAIKRAYPEQNVVPSLLLAPYWSEYPEVYSALAAFGQKINGHWFSFIYADIPTEFVVEDTKTLTVTDHAASYTVMSADSAMREASVQHIGAYNRLDTLVVYKPNGDAAVAGTDYTAADTGSNITIILLSGGALYSADSIDMSVRIFVRNDSIDRAKKFREEKGFNSEFSKVFWPKAQTGSNTVYHLSTLACAETLRRDEQHGGVPFESIDNISIPVVRPYYGDGVEYFMDNETADELCASGITTLISWGGANVLWGAHTAAYEFGMANVDPRAIFDCMMRMLFYILNGFQLRNIHDIGRPMTLRHAQEIINRENDEYARYAALGALLGEVSIEFIAEENSTADMMNGDFRFSFNPTIVPPLKSVTLGVSYSDAGYDAYFETFAGGEAA